jgi:general secretion pathway protein E
MQPLPFSWARDARIVLTHQAGQWRALAAPGASEQSCRLFRLARPGLVLETVSDAEFDAALSAAYSPESMGADGLLADTASADLGGLLEELEQIPDLMDASDEAPVIRLINAVLTQAIRLGASDIHLESFESHAVIRLRIDGSLRDVARPPRALHAALVSRIKILSGLDIAEKRLPQDGRISLRLAGRAIDLRVSTLPTVHGERTVLRILERNAERLDLARLGMTPAMLASMDRLVHQPHGIVLVTGPTGSGKTTTLYAALRRLDATQSNILTVEDPVEYELPGIGQTQVNARIDMGFATALRAILRQDPDVIMIGEIRDLETAQIAIQASLTGHLVLATLHTNDTCAAVTRLIDMGVEPFLLSSTLTGVLAQRLVRTLCDACARPDPDYPGRRLPVGCPACGHTGYRGRTGVFELLELDDSLRRLVHEQAAEQALRAQARQRGLVLLHEDAQRWVDSGRTSMAEVLRLTQTDRPSE